MHIAFLTNPASGEVNVQLATAQELVDQGHSVTFLSTAACSSKVSRFRVAQLPCNQHRIHFISLGSSQALNDFTRMAQSRMHLMRRVPGDPISLQTCTDASVGPAEDHAAMAIRVRDLLNELDPDMICVDALTSSVITGARLTKRKFILTVPCSPGMTALRSAFQPHMVAANRRGSWGTFFENMYLNLHEVIHSRRHPYRREQHKVIKRLGLRSYGTARDSACVGPNWQDENCVAGIHFNTPGLIDCPKQSPKMVFVGAGVAAEHSPSPFTPPPTMPPTPSMDPVGAFPELAWMDEAAARGEDVVYMNMGSMFLWQPDEFDACIEGFKAAHKRLNGRVRFLFKINRPPQSRSSTANTASNTTPEKEKENTAERELSIEDLDLTLPPFIRLTHWISNQTAVYTHRALKAFIHHGGGNSFNEAVHFAVPQLVLSQWLDTHEYASYAQKFGLGLRSEHPPSVQACDLEAKILELLGPRWAEFKATCQAWALRSELGGGPAAAARIVLFHAQLCAADAGARRKQSGDGSGSSTETELTPPLSPEQVSGFEKDVKEIAIS